MATAMLILTPELKKALVEEAERAGANVNDVAVALLAKAHGFAFEPTGRSARSAPRQLAVTLRMPDQLKRLIDVSAASRGRSMRREIISTLETELGLAAAA